MPGQVGHGQDGGLRVIDAAPAGNQGGVCRRSGMRVRSPLYTRSERAINGAVTRATPHGVQELPGNSLRLDASSRRYSATRVSSPSKSATSLNASRATCLTSRPRSFTAACRWPSTSASSSPSARTSSSAPRAGCFSSSAKRSLIPRGSVRTPQTIPCLAFAPEDRRGGATGGSFRRPHAACLKVPSPPPPPVCPCPEHFILDECDQMLQALDMRRDVQEIFKNTPHEKQVSSDAHLPSDFRCLV